jgi:hypothetical protein
MSDIVLGAIIGGGFAVIGGIVVGIINWKQLKDQLRHSEINALIDRRSKARESYLIPLREALSKYIANAIKGISAYAVLKEMERKKMELELRMKPYETIMDSFEAGGQIMDQIDILSGQICDIDLSKMIEDFKQQQIDLETELKPHAKLFANITDMDPKIWNSLLRQYNSAVSRQRHRLIPINKRIEQLLTGEADTTII